MRSTFTAIVFASLFATFFSVQASASNVRADTTPKIAVDWNLPVTGSEGGALDWFEIKSDPENSENLIVCGATWKSRDNAYYGVVYFSHDAGKHWIIALEDRSSKWVSEQSCAFGRNHRAYFISEASHVVDGQPHHDLGTTRLFVSSDGGESWKQSAETTWADYSSSVVASSNSGERLYVVYNSAAEYDANKQRGSVLGYFVVTQNGTTLSQHRTVPGMSVLNYQGVYPSSSVTLNDGSVVTLYNAGTAGASHSSNISLEIGVVRFTGEEASGPTVVARPMFNFKPPLCPSSLSTSLAYDTHRDTLYVAYNTLESQRCRLMLTSSRDKGKTWSKPRELLATKTHQPAYFPILTINPNGVLGLLWKGRPSAGSGCWFFSTSRDGTALDDTVALSSCVAADSLETQRSAFLATAIERLKPERGSSVSLLSFRDYLTRIGICATADGAFHPVWSGLGQGSGELRTARIWADRLREPIADEHIGSLHDVTDKLTVLYGGEQQLDRQSRSVMVDLRFRNDSSDFIPAHLRLQIENSVSDFGRAEFVDAVRVKPDPEPHSDTRSYLQPGEVTDNYRLTFHIRTHTPATSYEQNIMVKFRLRVFSELP